MNEVMSLENISNTLECKLRCLPYVSKVIRETEFTFNPIGSGEESVTTFLDIYCENVKYLFTLNLVYNSRTNGVDAKVLGEYIFKDALFHSEEEIEVCFRNEVIPVITNEYYEDAVSDIFYTSILAIKKSGKDIPWSLTTVNVGSKETGTVFKVGSDSFEFMYPTGNAEGGRVILISHIGIKKDMFLPLVCKSSILALRKSSQQLYLKLTKLLIRQFNCQHRDYFQITIF